MVDDTLAILRDTIVPPGSARLLAAAYSRSLAAIATRQPARTTASNTA